MKLVAAIAILGISAIIMLFVKFQTKLDSQVECLYAAQASGQLPDMVSQKDLNDFVRKNCK